MRSLGTGDGEGTGSLGAGKAGKVVRSAGPSVVPCTTVYKSLSQVI